MKSYFIPRVVHMDSSVPSQPLFDLLISICNPYDRPQVVRYRFFDASGKELTGMTYTLAPGRSVATTLIERNVFPDPPQNFAGYGILEFPDASAFEPGLVLPAMCCLGGNGPSPANWNQSAPSVPMLDAAQISTGPGSRWVFPYVIHFTDPAQHAGAHSYVTGLSIVNREGFDVSLNLILTVADCYANAGQKLQAQAVVPAGVAYAIQLDQLFPGLTAMNPRADGSFEGMEGWLDITLAENTGPVNLAMWMVNANATYDCFGVGHAPWIIEA